MPTQQLAHRKPPGTGDRADRAPAAGSSRGTMSRAGRVADAIKLSGVAATAAVSGRAVRPLAGELTRSLPGDGLVAEPKLRWDLAITIEARPALDRPGATLTYDVLALGLFFKLFWHPTHFAMQRKQLLKLKRLAEATP